MYSVNVWASKRAYIKLQTRNKVSIEKTVRIFELTEYGRDRFGLTPTDAKFFCINWRIFILDGCFVGGFSFSQFSMISISIDKLYLFAFSIQSSVNMNFEWEFFWILNIRFCVLVTYNGDDIKSSISNIHSSSKCVCR